jgi:hypothetical protein
MLGVYLLPRSRISDSTVNKDIFRAQENIRLVCYFLFLLYIALYIVYVCIDWGKSFNFLSDLFRFLSELFLKVSCC